MENFSFQADAKQILRLVTHSIYSDKEVFLRELLSNASDALDKARFLALKDSDLRQVENPQIRISFDEESNTITIEDDGVGMNREEIIENLGTIAQSGTKSFGEKLDSGESLESLIGQFGVGFYSAFMVADRVEVTSLSIQSDSEAVFWSSDGGDGYNISDGQRDNRGTTIVIYLREDESDFADEFKLKDIVRKHSDFIQWPIHLGEERINQDTALWLRNPQDVTEEEYNAFYKHITKDYQDPLASIHFKIEGDISFNAVIFIPKKHSWQLDNINYQVDLKLFQKRIQVIEHANDLLPPYLRFISGVVDSPDVELNVSREILQQNRASRIIKKQITKKVLRKLQQIAEENPEAYNDFWEDMGIFIKHGIHEDQAQKDNLIELLRAKTTTSEDQWKSLAQMKESMLEDQEDLWFLSSVTNREQIATLPALEGFKKRKWEVMLLTDPVDEWVVMSVNEYDGTPLKSVNQGEFEDEENSNEELEEARSKAAPLVDWLQDLLEEEVEEVRISNRLTSSPSVLVDKDGSSNNFNNILRQLNPGQAMPESKRVLEINPSHALVQTLSRLNNEGRTGIEPFARLLLDHAQIAEGELLDPAGFTQRLQGLMEKAAEGLS